MTATDPAVTAAAEAAGKYLADLDLWAVDVHAPVIGAATVAAARPVIEAEVRQRIAAAIRAYGDNHGGNDEWWDGYDSGVEDAARIAEETP